MTARGEEAVRWSNASVSFPLRIVLGDLEIRGRINLYGGAEFQAQTEDLIGCPRFGVWRQIWRTIALEYSSSLAVA